MTLLIIIQATLDGTADDPSDGTADEPADGSGDGATDEGEEGGGPAKRRRKRSTPEELKKLGLKRTNSASTLLGLSFLVYPDKSNYKIGMNNFYGFRVSHTVKKDSVHNA